MVLAFRMLRMHLASRFIYKINFFLGTSTLLLLAAAPIVSLWVITNRFGTIGEWEFMSLMLMYAMWRTSHGLFMAFWQGQTFGFDQIVRRGELDHLLLRPHHPLFMLGVSSFNIAGIGGTLTGLIGLVISIYFLKLSIVNILIVTLIILCGFVIQTSLYLLVGSLAFWTNQSEGLREIMDSFNITFNSYPIHIYGEFVQTFLTFVVPFAFVAYYPSLNILGTVDGLLFGDWLKYFFPAVALIAMVISISVWNVGLRRYSSSGT